MSIVHAHGTMISKDEEVAMAQAFVAKMGNHVVVVMDPMTKLDVDHHDHP